MKTEIKKLPKSELEIDFELSDVEFAVFIDKALEHLKGHVKMDGFRKGHVPKEMVEQRVGQENLLMEAGDLAVKDAYTKFVVEQKLEPIGEPEVKITKIAKGNPLLFTIKVAVLPDIKLPDYKKIVSEIKGLEVSVEPKEIDEALVYLQKSRAKFSQVDKPAGLKDFVEIEYTNENINSGKIVKDRFILGEGGFMKDFEDNVLEMKAGEEKEFRAKFPDNAPNNLAGKESSFKVKMLSVQKMELAEINDEFAKSLGMFDSLVKLKENLLGGITLEKKEAELQRKRGEILQKISEKIKFYTEGGSPPKDGQAASGGELPEKMVEYEQKRLLEDLKMQVQSQFKLEFEEYLKSVKKTEEEIKASFKVDAEKRIKNFLVLRQIGKAENVEVTEEELTEEANREMKKYSKEQAAKIDIRQLKEYSKGAVFNEKVFQKLESFSK